MDQQQAEQNHFKGFALLELYGHQKEAGFVETCYFGTACMFRVDVPGLDEREYVLEAPAYGEHTGYRQLQVGVWPRRGMNHGHVLSGDFQKRLLPDNLAIAHPSMPKRVQDRCRRERVAFRGF